MVRIRLDVGELPDGFQMVDPGRWPARLIEVERDVSAANNRMLVCTWKVTGGPSQGRSIRSWAVLEPVDSLWNLKQLLTAFGYAGRIDIQSDDLVGGDAMITVVHSEMTKDDGTTVPRCNVEYVDSMKEDSDSDDDDDDIVIGDADDDDDEDEVPVAKSSKSRASAEGGGRSRAGGGGRRRAGGGDAETEAAPAATATRSRRRAAPAPADEDDEDDDLPFN